MQSKGIYKWLGIFFIFVSGLIHLYSAPDELKDTPYMGILFLLFFLGAVISSVGIHRRSALWGWGLGGLLAVGAIVGYLVSRTVGMPAAEVEAWGPPIAYFCFALELLFIVLAIRERPLRSITKGVA